MRMGAAGAGSSSMAAPLAAGNKLRPTTAIAFPADISGSGPALGATRTVSI